MEAIAVNQPLSQPVKFLLDKVVNNLIILLFPSTLNVCGPGMSQSWLRSLIGRIKVFRLLFLSSLLPLPLVERLGQFNVQTELLSHQRPDIRALNWERDSCFSSRFSINNLIAI